MAENRIARMQQKILKLVMEELQGLVNDIMRGMLDPSKILAFVQSMGIDPSKLPGMMSQQPGFDPYRILGLEKSASDEEVKKRYRERVRQFHPDTAGPGMEFHLQCTLAAYELIKKEREWQ